MMHEIFPSKLKGKVRIPSSKSYVQRFIAAACLANGQSYLKNVGHCDDIITAIIIGDQLGNEARHLTNGDLMMLGGPYYKGDDLYCRESGLCARLFTPIAATQGLDFNVVGTTSLERRHIAEDFKQLKMFGLDVNIQNRGIPSSFKGKLKPGKFTLDCSKSSQMLSGLLFALPVLNGDSEIYAKDLVSRPYVDMTLQMMQRFGIEYLEPKPNVFQLKGNQQYQANSFYPEADWSAAANMLVAGAIAGDIELLGLNADSTQADLRILDVLNQAGVKYEIKKDSIAVKKSEIKGFELDLMDCPDLFPAILPLACAAKSVSKVYHLERLIHKESNRLEAAMREYAKLGANFNKTGNNLEIHPQKLNFADVNSWGDHRIIMSLCVAGLGNKGLIIHDSDHVSKSWPDFFSHIKDIGGSFDAFIR